jgi:hypothetical protein
VYTGWNRRSRALSVLNVLAVLVQRRRTDGVQLSAGERRLDQVGGIGRPFRRSGSDDRMQFIDEQDDLAFGLYHFV